MTQNIILFVALVGVIYRVCSRQIIAREWWIIGFVSLNIFLVQLQMFVGEKGNLTWILRYHQAALTLLYGWAAWTVVALARALTSRWRMCVVYAGVFWLAATGGTSMWRIVKHRFVDSRRNAQLCAAEWAAEIIRKDWKGPLLDEERFFTIQDYHPRLRPIIHTAGAVLVQKVNGRWYSLAPDIRRHEKPDYAFCLEGEKTFKGMKLLAKKTFGKKKKRTFFLYCADKKNFDTILEK
jgi:hypothetical protein